MADPITSNAQCASSEREFAQALAGLQEFKTKRNEARRIWRFEHPGSCLSDRDIDFEFVGSLSDFEAEEFALNARAVHGARQSRVRDDHATMCAYPLPAASLGNARQ
jgi:hypothetical protein